MGFVIINDYKFDFKKLQGLALIQTCQKLLIDVPRFCFHDNLSVAGNCRICLVEDVKQVKPVASCSITTLPGSVIYTNTVKVKKAREAVLEFLLINHPLDCPIRDQGGECDLQDQTVVFGSDRGRFYENKRAVEDFYCGPFIKTIMNRCIHRTRCVRFSKEVVGAYLGVMNRGAGMEIGFYIEKLFDNELSGNVIDLCPVGASTSKPFAFTARPWELKNYNSISLFDPLHVPIRIDVRGTRIMRILPRITTDYPLEWIDDRTRFSYDAFRRQRLYDPMVKISGKWIKVSWKSAFFFLKAVFIKRISNLPQFLHISNYLGTLYDIYSLNSLKSLMNLMSSNLLGYGKSDSNNSNYLNNFVTDFSRLANISIASTIFILGLNLRQSLPVLNAKVKSLVKSRNLGVLIIGPISNFNYYAKHLVTSGSGILSIIEGLHWSSSSLSKSLIITSENFDVCKNQANVFNISTNSVAGALNLIPTSIPAGQNSSVVFNWNSDYSCDVLTGEEMNVCEIYVGTHGDSNVLNANMILPSTSVIEQDGLFLNAFGFIQKADKVLFKIGNSRNESSIIKALITYLKLDTKMICTSPVSLIPLSLSTLDLKFKYSLSTFFNKKIKLEILSSSLKMLKFSKIFATTNLAFKKKSNFDLTIKNDKI